MKVIPNPMTIGDYITAVEGKSICVNQDYQRGGGIWSHRAKSALIETVILGYPMPALFLQQLYNKNTRKPYRDLVDGQQRTDAIFAFSRGKMSLSTTLPTVRLRKRRLEDLEEEDYRSFITYSLPIFLFTDASDADVREAFRRINSHTSVLNSEERRHSRFQGAMKWFVLSLSKDVQGYLKRWSVLTEPKLIRMQDAKLVSELLLTYKSGIRTVKERQLDDLYQRYEEETALPDQDLIRDQILDAFGTLADWDWIHSTALMKPYQLTLLLLAIVHAKHGVEPLNTETAGSLGLRPRTEIEARLSELVRALEVSDILVGGTSADEDNDDGDTESEDFEDEGRPQSEDVDPRLKKHIEFVKASASKTNTESARRVRFRALYEAVARTLD